MCPLCLTTWALIATGGASAGGLGLCWLTRRLRAKPETKEENPQ
ncbi:MAG TPA: hypothetical protein VJA19_09370 [Pseudomonas sp.]|nr:hypothetical protein [Pseudomonas sp.]